MSHRRLLNKTLTKPEPNTFIGGVGATINTPALLVAQLSGITESNITSFTVDVNNNVSCLIDADYSLNANAFQNNTDLSWLIDLGNHMIGIGANSSLNGCTNLKYLYAPAALNIGFNGAQGALTNLNNLEKVNFNSATSVGRNTISNANIKILRLPVLTTSSVTNLGYSNFQGLSFLERLDIRNINTVNIFYNDNPFFNNIKTGCKILYNPYLGVANRNAWATASFNSSTANGNTFTLNGLVYTAGNSTNNTGQFNNITGNQNVRAAALVSAINTDTRSGTLGKVLAQVASTFIGFYVSDVTGASGNSITVSNTSGTPLSSISNGGNFQGGNDLHKALMYLRDERSCTMIEATTPISVPTPTGLSYSNQTANTVDLNFTEPTPNANGTECFEAWVDDGTLYRKLFEFKEIVGNGSTLDLSEVITDVGTLTGTKIKIRTMDGQMNYSDFSNEIIIT